MRPKPLPRCSGAVPRLKRRKPPSQLAARRSQSRPNLRNHLHLLCDLVCNTPSIPPYSRPDSTQLLDTTHREHRRRSADGHAQIGPQDLGVLQEEQASSGARGQSSRTLLLATAHTKNRGSGSWFQKSTPYTLASEGLVGTATPSSLRRNNIPHALAILPI